MLKRICLLILVFLTAGGLASAQEYEVASFENDVRDLSAKTNMRVDRNGRPCALLKVYADDNIAEVHGSSIGEVEVHGMAKWVYVTHDSKEIELVFENHYPLHITFDDFFYPSVSQQMTYIVKLRSRPVAVPAPPAAMLQPVDEKAREDEIIEAYTVERDYRKCFELAMTIPENRVAQACVGEIYYYGHLASPNYAEAVKWYRKAAGQGYAAALYMLGVCYENGYGVLKDEHQARTLYEQASAAGNMAAADALAALPADGEPVAPVQPPVGPAASQAATYGSDFEIAMELCNLYEGGCYARAVELAEKYPDNVASNFYLALCHGYGEFKEKDGVLMRKHARLVTDMADSSEDNVLANYYAGKLFDYEYLGMKDKKKAQHYFMTAFGRANALENSGKGDEEVHYVQSRICYEGKAGKKDKDISFQIFQHYALEGRQWALIKVGDCYMEGEGVKKNEAEALKWFEKAASAGSVRALIRIGYIYCSASDKNLRDVNKGLEARKQAAEQGSAMAMYILSMHYRHGKDGCPKDEIQSQLWLAKAKECGLSAFYYN